MNNIITNRLANRLGPLSVLPVEILISIFALLSTSDRLKARAVCTAWNEWIMNTPLVWASTEVTRSNSKTICGVLPIVAGHIEKIVVLWDANSFLTPMAQGLFKNLKSFEMLGIKTPNVNYVEEELSLSALRAVRNTLTEVYLDFKLTPEPPTYFDICQACPNLKKIGYYVNHFKWPRSFYNQNYILNTDNDITFDKIVEADIGANRVALTSVDVETVLKQCPNLKNLSVTRFPYQRFIGIIASNGMHLERITFNRRQKCTYHQDNRFPVTFPKTLPYQPGKLHSLCLMEDDFSKPMPWESLLPILEQAASTLHHLSCSLKMHNTKFTRIFGANPRPIAFPNLYSVKLCVGDTKSQKYAASLLTNAPKLAAIAIRNYSHGKTDDGILDALFDVKSLKWLELLEESKNKQLSNRRLCNLIKKHADLGDDAPLQYVSFDGQFLNRAVLEELAKVTSLRGVDLGFSDVPLGEFLSAMAKEHPHFREIHLTRMSSVTNFDLALLTQIRDLTRIHLLGCKSVDGTGLYRLLTSSSLQELVISKETSRRERFDAIAREKLARFMIDSHYDDSWF